MNYSVGDTVYISGIPWRVEGYLAGGYFLREKIPPFRTVALPTGKVESDNNRSDLPYNHRY